MSSLQERGGESEDFPQMFGAFSDAFADRLENGERKIGIEEEYAVVNQYGIGGFVGKIFPDFLALGWDPKYDSVTGALVGVSKDEIEIGYDVGIFQLEVGFPPNRDLIEHATMRIKTFALVDGILAKYGLFRLKDYGAQPITAPQRDHWADKGRGNHFKDFFCDLVHAQTSSASSQIHLDVRKSELIPALKVLNSLAGPLIALGANSPFWGGAHDPQSMLAARQVFWYRFLENYGFWNNIFIGPYLSNPQGALGSLPRNINELMGFISNTKFIVGVKGGKLLTPNMLFGEWLKSQGELSSLEYKDALKNHEATIWWDARPRVAYGTIEVRPACQGENALARHAFCLGLVSNLYAALELVNRRSYKEWRYMKFDALRKGLYARGGIVEATKLAVSIAHEGLVRRGYGEEVFLDFDSVLSQDRPESPGHKKLRVIERGGVEALIELLLT